MYRTKILETDEIPIRRWTPESRLPTAKQLISLKKNATCKSLKLQKPNLRRKCESEIILNKYSKNQEKSLIKLPVVSPSFSVKRNFYHIISKEFINRTKQSYIKKIRDYQNTIIHKSINLSTMLFTTNPKIGIPMRKKFLPLNKKYIFKF